MFSVMDELGRSSSHKNFAAMTFSIPGSTGLPLKTGVLLWLVHASGIVYQPIA